MDERRSVPRWAINKDAQFTVADGLRPIPCTVEDISTHGMCLSSGRNLFPEAFSNINLALSDDCMLNLGAQVAWQEEAGEKNIYGLKFHGVEEHIKDKITQFVKDYFPQELTKQWWKGDQDGN